jgi:hypothetical protein
VERLVETRGKWSGRFPRNEIISLLDVNRRYNLAETYKGPGSHPVNVGWPSARGAQTQDQHLIREGAMGVRFDYLRPDSQLAQDWLRPHGRYGTAQNRQTPPAGNSESARARVA